MGEDPPHVEPPNEKTQDYPPDMVLSNVGDSDMNGVGSKSYTWHTSYRRRYTLWYIWYDNNKCTMLVRKKHPPPKVTNSHRITIKLVHHKKELIPN